MEGTDNIIKDFFYSAVMMNTDINYKTLTDLTDNKAITNYRDLADKDLLDRIVSAPPALKPETVNRISNLSDSYIRIMDIALGYKNIADKENISVKSCLDKDYPYNWKMLSGMPKVFYFKGSYDIITRMTLNGSCAVVGSRNASKYSVYATEKICGVLGNKGITIVSGMAFGIDRSAHLASVSTPGGTVAVLAGGADNIYPPANKDIYDAIAAQGLIVSEMPPGQKPLRQYFPSRNRLIAGLSDCTLIMEAGAVSGTLHTASFAAAQGKEVFVLPNNIYYENALGGLKLLEDGGNVLLGPDSVIDSIARSVMYRRIGIGCRGEIPFLDKDDEFENAANVAVLRELARANPEELTDNNWKMLISDALTLKPLCADELCNITSLPFYKVSKLLTELELNGTVCQEKGKYSLTFV